MDRDALRAELDRRLAGGTEVADGRDVTLLCADCVNPQLAAFAQPLLKSGYGNYLLGLLEL
jgi:hypothetical protein